MVIGVALGAIASLAGLIAQSQAQAQQAQVMRDNLAFQKAQADREYDLSTSDRTDAFGNTVGYDDVLDKWETELSPMQSRLVKSGEREQLLSLTEDAERDRGVKRRQDLRSREAGEVYNDLLARYEHDEPEDEDTIFDEIIGDVTGMRAEAGNAAKNVLGGQAARMGRSGDLTALLQEATGGAGSSDVFQAKEQARAQAGERQKNHRGILDELSTFGNIMDDVGGSQLRFSDAPGRMDATQSSMLQQIASAISGGATRVGGAITGVANTLQAPDYSSLASSLSNLKLGGGEASQNDPRWSVSGTGGIPGQSAQRWSMSGVGDYPYDDPERTYEDDYSTF